MDLKGVKLTKDKRRDKLIKKMISVFTYNEKQLLLGKHYIK